MSEQKYEIQKAEPRWEASAMDVRGKFIMVKIDASAINDLGNFMKQMGLLEEQFKKEGAVGMAVLDQGMTVEQADFAGKVVVFRTNSTDGDELSKAVDKMRSIMTSAGALLVLGMDMNSKVEDLAFESLESLYLAAKAAKEKRESNG